MDYRIFKGNAAIKKACDWCNLNKELYDIRHISVAHTPMTESVTIFFENKYTEEQLKYLFEKYNIQMGISLESFIILGRELDALQR